MLDQVKFGQANRAARACKRPSQQNDKVETLLYCIFEYVISRYERKYRLSRICFCTEN